MATLYAINALRDQKRYLEELDLHINQLSQQLNSTINNDYEDSFKHIAESVHEASQDIRSTNVSEPGQSLPENSVSEEENTRKISEIKTRIIKIHLEALNQVLLNSSPSANEILSLHIVLKRGFAAIIDRCDTTGNLEVLPLKINCIREINSLLDVQYESHVNSSSSKLKLAIAKAINKYKELMKISMDQKPWPYGELQEFHSDCSEKAIKEFQLALQCFEIQNDAGNSEKEIMDMALQQFLIFIDENDGRLRELINLPIRKKMKLSESSENSSLDTQQLQEIFGTSEKQNSDFLNGKVQQTLSTDTLENPNPDKPKEVTIAIEFGLSKIKVATWLNDIFQPIPTFVDNEDFPLRVAFSRRSMAVFGSEIDKQETQEPIFSITELMLTPTDEFVSSTSVTIRGYPSSIEPKKEFIFAVLLAKLKKEAETFLKSRVTGAIITVPLWYTISQRQSTMDSGKIAGFSTVDLINEHTAVALAYYNQCNLTECSANTISPFHVLIANKYRYDIAKFSLHSVQREEPFILKMNCSSGNLHKSRGDLFNRPKNWFKMPFQDLLSKDEFNGVLTNILADVPGKIVTFYVACESEEQKKDIIWNAMKTKGQFVAQPEISNAILLGAVQFSELLNSSFLNISKIEQPLVYQIECFHVEHAFNAIIFSTHCNTPRQYKLKLLDDTNLVFNIYENGIASCFKMGELKILRKHRGRDAFVNFVSDTEGFFQFFTKYDDVNEEVPSVWTPVSLSDEAVSFYASLFKS